MVMATLDMKAPLALFGGSYVYMSGLRRFCKDDFIYPRTSRCIDLKVQVYGNIYAAMVLFLYPNI